VSLAKKELSELKAILGPPREQFGPFKEDLEGFTLLGGDTAKGLVPGRKPDVPEAFFKTIDLAAQKAQDKIDAVNASLKFNIKQLSRSSIEQEVYSNLLKAGTDESTKAGQAIAEQTRKLVEQEEALKAEEKATKDATRVQEQAEKSIKRVTEQLIFNIEQLSRSNLEQEIHNNLLSAGVTLQDEAGQKIAELTKEFERQNEILELQKDIADSVGDAFTDFFDDAIDGTKSLADSFTDMANSILKDIQRIIIKKQISEPIGNFLSSALGNLFGGGSISGGSGTSLGSTGIGGDTLGLATGGSFQVGGTGGPDSQFVPLRLTPGETVNVRKGGQDSGAPTINIINNNSSQNQVQAGLSPNGKDITILIDEAVARNIRTPGSKTFNSIRNFSSAPLSRG